MHARVQVVSTLPKPFEAPEATTPLIRALEAQPGFRGVQLMVQIGSRQALNLTLWETRDDADAAPARTQSVVGPRPFPLAVDDVYEVMATVHGPTALDDATVCQVSWFDGPRSAAENAAMQRAGEERIQPAIEAVPGHAVTYVLCRPENSGVVIVTLAESTETLNGLADAVSSTTLLPGEDPALLTGPDRIEVYTLANQSRLAASVR